MRENAISSANATSGTTALPVSSVWQVRLSGVHPLASPLRFCLDQPIKGFSSPLPGQRRVPKNAGREFCIHLRAGTEAGDAIPHVIEMLLLMLLPGVLAYLVVLGRVVAWQRCCVHEGVALRLSSMRNQSGFHCST